VEIYGLGAWFPVAFSASAVLIGIASFLNSRLVQRFGMRRLSHGALVGFACVSFLNLMATLVAGQPAPFPLFYALMTMGFCFFGFIGTNFNALAMEPLGHLAGTASSVLGAIQVVGGGLIGAAIGYTYDGTVLPLMLGFVLLSLASLLVVLITERGRLFRAGEPAPGVAGASSR
jgi:DHA1 family bicyclomycin/chloramphenicol resistance-like MFS transporter